MPNAIITTTNYAGNGTQAGFLNAISSAMLIAGFSLLDSYVSSGNENRVWNFLDTTNGNATFDNLILEAGFTAATTIRVRGFSSFDTATDTGSNVSTETPTATIGLTNSFNIYSVAHPELRGVFVFAGGSTILSIFYLRPNPGLLINSASVNGWWNRNSAPLAFIPRVNFSNFTSLQTISSLRPGSVGTTCSITAIAATNPASANFNTRFQYPATIDTGSLQSSLAMSCDFCVAPASGMAFGDTLNNQFTFIEGLNTSQSRLFIKTT